MLKAGALYYAILISFLVSISGGFLILSVWLNHERTLVILTRLRMETDVRSVLVMAKEMPEILNIDETKEFDLYDDENHKVTLSKHLWGGYYVVKAEARWRNLSMSVIELCGQNVFDKEQTALYLADRDRYLSLSGNTVIKGNCYLPKSGIRKAYIEGMSFTGDKLINGIVKHSKSRIPAFDASFIDLNHACLGQNLTQQDGLAAISLLLKKDSLSNSFHNKTVVFYSSQWITLTGKALSGNIRIVSSKGITIDKTSRIDGILLYAPRIEVISGFSGTVQLFATDTLKVGSGVSLLFPSLVAIIKPGIPEPLLEIDKECILAGDIVLDAPAGLTDPEGKCTIGEETKIAGRIYCNGKLELKGEVRGSVYANAFTLRTPGSVYENHLLNAVIDFSALPPEYSGAVIQTGVGHYQCIKWLD